MHSKYLYNPLSSGEMLRPRHLSLRETITSSSKLMYTDLNMRH